MGKSTISVAIFNVAFGMFTRPGISWLLDKPTNPTVVTFGGWNFVFDWRKVDLQL